MSFDPRYFLGIIGPITIMASPAVGHYDILAGFCVFALGVVMLAGAFAFRVRP